MSLLLIAKIKSGLRIPDFGPTLAERLTQKKHPGVRDASLTAWNLLALALEKSGVRKMPEVCYLSGGKPVFRNSELHFSLSHGAEIAAALLSAAPCAVDVECVVPDKAQRLKERCLNARELALGCDFYECWTRKECMAKLDGRGMPAHPSALDSLDPALDGCFFSRRVRDARGQDYCLTALCTDREMPEIIKIEPEAL